ncbi:hypothetical protein FHS72_000853 [Loktanella ponticola]|uniref:YCII-related domain-containing protein n=1 Tax=Yoonia ponticola TaxID=1524255 RepID=A0A7W9BJ28_9RHOB|nr:YciI family protein [Yoonia ponticola]MBB5721246.1 hypothetical protein [Yoonia ponticola]
MLVALMARDKSGALQTRLDNRDAHLAHLKSSGIVEMAGPLLDADGGMCGSLIVLNVENMGQAQAFVEADPYGKAGLFDNVTLDAWNKVLG